MSTEQSPDTGTEQTEQTVKAPEVSNAPIFDLEAQVRATIDRLNKNPGKVQGWGESSWRKPLS